MKQMELIYVAGPYRGKSKIRVINFFQRLRNIHRARKAAKELWGMGYAVICPHSNSAMMDGVCPDENFLAGTLSMMAACDKVVLLDGWVNSSGTWGEINKAKEWHIPVEEYQHFQSI